MPEQMAASRLCGARHQAARSAPGARAAPGCCSQLLGWMPTANKCTWRPEERTPCQSCHHPAVTHCIQKHLCCSFSGSSGARAGTDLRDLGIPDPRCRARAQHMRSHSYGALCHIYMFSYHISVALLARPCGSLPHPRSFPSHLCASPSLLFSLAPCPSQTHSLCSSCLMCCSRSLKRPCSSPRPPVHELLMAMFWVLVSLVPGLRMLSLAPCISKGKTGDIPAPGTALTQSHAGAHAGGGRGTCFIQDFPDCFVFWLRMLPS